MFFLIPALLALVSLPAPGLGDDASACQPAQFTMFTKEEGKDVSTLHTAARLVANSVKFDECGTFYDQGSYFLDS